MLVFEFMAIEAVDALNRAEGVTGAGESRQGGIISFPANGNNALHKCVTGALADSDISHTDEHITPVGRRAKNRVVVSALVESNGRTV